MASPDGTERPADPLGTGIGGVFVDGRSAALLNEVVLDRIRSKVRLRDAQLDAVLQQLRRAGLEYLESCATGTKLTYRSVPVPPLNQQHENTVGTTAAAALLGISDSAVRKACREKRMKATVLDGRYRITPYDLAAYAARR